MVLSLHIIIALTSLIVAAMAILHPSRRLFTSNYALIAATFTSGVMLVAQHPTHIATACISGLCYLAVVSTLTIFAARKFAHEVAQQ